MVDVQWESVFWVVIPQNLEDGTRVKVSFKCKASAETTANTQCHNAPNDYLHYNCFGDVPFTTEWNTYSTVFSVPSACGGNFHSIAFILTKDEDITYYFDNIVVAVDKALAVNPQPFPEEDVEPATVVTVAEFNQAEVSADVWYQLTGEVCNLKDGDKFGNFDLVDETGSVYVYGLLSERGGEKKHFQELVAEKGIQNGSKLTIIGTRGEYRGKIQVDNAYFVSVDNSSLVNPQGDVVTFDFNASGHAVSDSNGSNDGDITENLVIIQSGVTMTVTPANEGVTTPNRFWGTTNGPQLRMYSGTMTLTAPSSPSGQSAGASIVKVVVDNSNWNPRNTFNGVAATNGKWTGDGVVNIADIIAIINNL